MRVDNLHQRKICTLKICATFQRHERDDTIVTDEEDQAANKRGK